MRQLPRFAVRFALALAVMAALSAGCAGEKRSNATRASGELPDQEVSDFVLTETDAGHPQWTLYARNAATFTARDVIIARGVRMDFFDEKGVRSSSLTAREGEILQQKRDMTARGDVVLLTAQGWRMSTDELHYLNGQNLIVSDKLVRVERGGDVLEGLGFQSDPELRHFEFKQQVRATVRTKAGTILEPRGEKK